MEKVYKVEASLFVLFTLCLLVQCAEQATYKMKQHLLNVSEPVDDYGWIRLPMESQVMRAFNSTSKSAVLSVETESIQPDPNDKRNVFILYAVKVADLKLTPYRIGKLYEQAIKNGFEVLYETYKLYPVYDLPLKVFVTNNLIFTTFPPVQNFWFAEDLCYSKGARVIYGGLLKKSYVFLQNSLDLTVFSKIWVGNNVPYDPASARSEKFCKYHSMRRNADAPCDRAGHSVVCMKSTTRCYSEIEDKCGAGGQCYVTYSKYICKCLEGFVERDLSCEDLDECQFGNHTCSEYAICTNTVGSYECRCSLGLTGNGRKCARTLTMRQQFTADSFEQTLANKLELNRTSLKSILKSKNWNETINPLIKKSVLGILGTNTAENIQVTQIDKRPEEAGFYATVNITVTNLSITSDDLEEVYGRRIQSNQLLSISKVCTQIKLNETGSNDQSFMFGDAVIASSAYSYEKCSNTGRSKAMVDCRSINGTPRFDKSTLTTLACDATIKNIARQPHDTHGTYDYMHNLNFLKISSTNDVTRLSKQLYISTTLNITVNETFYEVYADLLKNLSNHLTNHNITISPEAYRYLVEIANVLFQAKKTMIAGLKQADRKSLRTYDFDIVTALRILTDLVQLDPIGYIFITTENIKIKVSSLTPKDNRIATKRGLGENANRRYDGNKNAASKDMIVWSFGVAQATFPYFSATRSARNSFLFFLNGDLEPNNDLNEPSEIFNVVSNAKLPDLKIYTEIPAANAKSILKEVSYRCAYRETNRDMDWLFDRCSTTWGEHSVNCTCSNVTDVSVLVIPKARSIRTLLMEVHEIIGIAFVLFGCVLTILVMASQKKLRVLIPVKRDIAFLLNILLTYLAMLVSAVLVMPPVVCLTLSYVYHFFYISAWGWMAFCVYLTYRKHESCQTSRQRCTCGVFGGIVITSSIIVAISIIVTFRAPNTLDDLMPYHASVNGFMQLPSEVGGKMCWVYGPSVYFTLFIPSSVAFIGTTIFLLAACSKTRGERTNRALLTEGVTRFVLSLLLLSSMIFAILSVRFYNEAVGFLLGWISAILNIILGIFICTLLLSPSILSICCTSRCLPAIAKADKGNDNDEIEMPTVSGLTTRSNND